MPAGKLDAQKRDWLLAVSHLFVQNGKLDEAVTMLRFLRLFAPKDLDACRLLMYAYLELGQSQKALKLSDFFSELELSEDDSSYLKFIRSRAYYELGMLDRAGAVWENEQIIERPQSL